MIKTKLLLICTTLLEEEEGGGIPSMIPLTIYAMDVWSILQEDQVNGTMWPFPVMVGCLWPPNTRGL